MTTEHNKTIVRRFFDEVVSNGNLRVVDELGCGPSPDASRQSFGWHAPRPLGFMLAFAVLGPVTFAVGCFGSAG